MYITKSFANQPPFYFIFKIALSNRFYVTTFLFIYLLFLSLNYFKMSKVKLSCPLLSSLKRWTKSVGSQLWDFPRWNMKLAPVQEGKERLRKKKATPDW